MPAMVTGWSPEGPKRSTRLPAGTGALPSGVSKFSHSDEEVFILVEGGQIKAGLTLAVVGSQRQVKTVWAEPKGGRGYRLFLAALGDAPTPLAADTCVSEGACRMRRRAKAEGRATAVPAEMLSAIDEALAPVEVAPVPALEWDAQALKVLWNLESACFSSAFYFRAMNRERGGKGRFLEINADEDSASLRKEYGWLAKYTSP